MSANTMVCARSGSKRERWIGLAALAAGALGGCQARGAPGVAEVEASAGAMPPAEHAEPDEGAGPGPEEALADAPAAENEIPAAQAAPANGPLVVSRGRCERAGCELVFQFSRPMVAADALDSEPPVIELDPKQEGRFFWRSPRELVFSPAPGALLWGQKVEVRLGRAVPLAGEAYALKQPYRETFRVPYFQAAGKVASWPVVAGKPRFVALLDSYQRMIGRGAELLLYDQPVDPDDVARFVRLSAGGDRLPVKVFRPRSIARVWEGKIDTSTIVAVKAARLPKDGTSVKLQYPARLDGDVPDIDSVRLGVRAHFRHLKTALAVTTPGGRAPLDSRIHLSFDGQVSAREARRRIHLRPKPETMQIWSWGTEVQISARLTPGRRYRLAVSPALEDTLGNRLGHRVTKTIRAQDRAPEIELPGAMVLERKRARVPIRLTNVAVSSVKLHRFSDPIAFVRARDARGALCASMVGQGSGARSFEVPAKAKLNRVVTSGIRLEGGTGLGCLQVSGRERGSEASKNAIADVALVQLTDLGVTAKVHAGGVAAWVTSLSDPKPVGGARVSLVTPQGVVLARAKTGEDGFAELSGAGIAKRGGLASRAYLVAEAGKDAAVTELEKGRLAQPWQFGLDAEVSGPKPLRASLFSDRGVYRPKETVHLAAVVRESGPGGALRAPKDRRLELRVLDPRGKEVTRKTLHLDRFGVADASVELSDGAAIGRYQARVSRGDRVTATSFRVAEYRVPAFEVKVSSDQERWGPGEKARALVTARYHHGGELAGRPVKYSVARVPVPVKAPGLAGFVFRDPDVEAPIGRVADGEGRLDGQGRLGLAFSGAHPPAAGPMRYVVEASVTDVDRQVYAGRLSRIVHPTDTYVGVKPPPRGVLMAGDTLEVPVVAVTPAGRPKPGVRVSLRLESIQYHTVARLAGGGVRQKSRPVATEIKRCRVKTRARPVTCRLRVKRAGYYRVVAAARDGSRRRVASAFKVTFGGERRIAWPRFDHERIEVLADKDRYRPGETARLMVESPFEHARGILTIERGGILEHRQFEIRGDSPILEVPIRESYAPNVYASVALLRGRIHDRKDATGFETGAPAFRIGYAALEVQPTFARLDVKVKPASEVARPGRRLAVDLEVRDAGGKPVAGRAIVMVVDEAVLGLTGYRTPDPRAALFARRPLGVRTASSRLDLPGARRARHEPLFPGGGGGPGFGIERPDPEVRDVFASTALFDAGVRVGADGHARVRVDLPDNVTTFRVMAVAVDRGTRAGSGDAKVMVRKPVLVRAAMPRFVHPGDVVRLEALVQNGTAAGAEARVFAGFTGLKARGPLSAKKEIAAGGQQSFSFPVEVTGREQATVRFSTRLGGHSDRIEVKLPILDPGTKRRLVESTRVAGDGTLELSIPKERVPGTARLEVMVSSTMLSELKGAVDYLMGYPNGCIEQTTSRAYPLVVLEDLLPDIGVDVDRAKLDEYARAGVKRLLSFQTSAGGLAYWPGSDKPHAFGTAFGLTALIEAKKRGYDVPDRALSRMADFLEKSLRSGVIQEEMPHGDVPDGDTRALFVMTLGRLGRPQPGYVSALWRERDKLTAFGLSFLAVAVKEGSGDHALLDPILAEIRRRAVEKKSEAYFEGKPDGGWSMGSPLRTDAGALLAYAAARPGAAMSPKLLTGLLARRRYGLWGNTQENVFGVMAVAKAVARKRGGKLPPARLTVNGTRRSLARAEKVSDRVRKLSLDEAALGLSKGRAGVQKVGVKNRGATPLYVTARAEWSAPLNKKTMAPVSKGFEVRRRYQTLGGEPLEGEIPLGSLVLVRLEVKSDGERHYVAVTDQLPAGLEALDTDLATTQSIEKRAPSEAETRGLGALSYSEVRDSRVSFYADELPAGTYEFSYLARATTAGRFLAPAAGAEAMYQPDAYGASAAIRVDVK